MEYLLVVFLFFISIFYLFNKDYTGFLLFILPCFSLMISSFLTKKNIEKEKTKKERKELFNSLLKPIPNTFKDGYSNVIILKVPSQNFFNEMTQKNEHKH